MVPVTAWVGPERDAVGPYVVKRLQVSYEGVQTGGEAGLRPYGDFRVMPAATGYGVDAGVPVTRPLHRSSGRP